MSGRVHNALMIAGAVHIAATTFRRQLNRTRLRNYSAAQLAGAALVASYLLLPEDFSSIMGFQSPSMANSLAAMNTSFNAPSGGNVVDQAFEGDGVPSLDEVASTLASSS